MAKTKKKRKTSPSGGSAPSARGGGVRSATTADLAAALRERDDLVLVDVRTRMEFAGGHVPQAANKPLGELSTWGATLPDEEIWLICRSGNRSGQAAAILARQGRTVVNVVGGMGQWSGPTKRLATPTALLMPLVASLTLGLAPFTPEPHVVEKLAWVARGADGMAPLDWFDLVLHGAPWIWLAFAAVRFIQAKRQTDDG